MIGPQPSIYPFGIRIDEPMTTLTDLFVSAVCFYAFYRLQKSPSKLRIHTFLSYYFLGMGIATTIGGIIGHGFLYALSYGWKLPGWITSMLAVALLERAAIEHAQHAVSPKLSRFFKWMNIIELLTFMSITFISQNFKFVEIHSAYGILFVVGSFSSYTFYKTKSKASKVFIYAVAVAILSSLFYLNEWSFHTWFNYLDISHTLMAIAAYIFYKGATLMIQENE
jgi:hypothetical protein